ncbi:ADP-ribosylation factor [Mycena alexandri]|uniref:ADP-ribosylation factor n=1 Tax=Mycena alexandri TaxID=1745969 RepID=A0AAD6T9P0_9AGAR|nr:ADP-ribosylation factor [Mycena alexandri]
MNLRGFFDRLYPRPANGYKIPLLGLNSSGKTTLLYRLKFGEVITTIPTIGFQVEKIRVARSGGPAIEMLCWDVGGCRGFGTYFIAPYAAGSDALIWLVDGSERERLSESVEELTRLVYTLTGNFTRGDLPILILVTKQDLPRQALIPMDAIHTKFEPVTKIPGCQTFIAGVSNAQSLTEGTFPEAIDWLVAAIEGVRAGKPLSSVRVPEIRDPSSVAALEAKLDGWLVRAESDSSAEECLAQFETFKLPAWDHYTHIRVAYLLLTIHGRQKGKNMIFDGIEKYIAQSEQTRGRTFHVTMTYFWIQMVHLGIRSASVSFPAPSPVDMEFKGDNHSTAQTLVEDTDAKSVDAFARFLVLNPFLADGNLWAEYYSKEVIMSPDAKATMVLPDKKPLPNIVTRDAIPGKRAVSTAK